MGPKRRVGPISDAEWEDPLYYAPWEPPHIKRARLSPRGEMRSDSGIPPDGSVSEDSALKSSPPVPVLRRSSSRSSSISERLANRKSKLHAHTSDDDSSGFGTSDEEIVNIGGPKKPTFDSRATLVEMKEMRDRLVSTIAQLEAEHKTLKMEKRSLNMEDVDEDEEHIEMNLGLGVLRAQNRQKTEDEEDTSSEESSESDSSDSEAKDDMGVCEEEAAREAPVNTSARAGSVRRRVLLSEYEEELRMHAEDEGTSSDFPPFVQHASDLRSIVDAIRGPSDEPRASLAGQGILLEYAR